MVNRGDAKNEAQENPQSELKLLACLSPPDITGFMGMLKDPPASCVRAQKELSTEVLCCPQRRPNIRTSAYCV